MKIQRIIMIGIISMIVLSNSVYAKYLYKFDETILELTRDGEAPVCNVSYSTEEWTNRNVIVTITVNEEVEQVSGFILSEDKKVLTKEVSENEYGTVVIRDTAGNCTEIEYEVNNIDKQAPQIIGCQDGGVYNKPLNINYTDNVEIKEIVVDKYSNNLILDFHDTYYDSYYYFGIDKRATRLEVQIPEHPLNTKKYRYYLNNHLYATTTDTKYIFTGLQKGTNYQIKVEALDKYGNILQTAVRDARTSYYHGLTSDKVSDAFAAMFWGVENDVAQVKYAVWNYYDGANTRWYDSEIVEDHAYIRMTHFNTAYYPSYVIHVYMYDRYGNILDLVPFSIDLQTSYTPKNTTININELTEAGNYQIMVRDLAGNETIYYIKVQ